MALTLFGSYRASSIIAQLESLPENNLDLVVAMYGGHRYVLDEAIAKKGSRGRSSWIRDHGVFVRKLVGSQKATGMICEFLIAEDIFANFQCLLALRQLQGAHTGQNLSLILVEIVRDWEIADQLGTLVSDNALSNNTCSCEFFYQIYPELLSDEIKDRRIRCYGHILNLVGRAFLYGEDFESFEQESQILEALDRHDDYLKLWRRRGPVGKLHNLVKWVRSSPQRSEYFNSTIKELDEDSGVSLSEQSTSKLQLVLSNEICWNSTFLMIKCAILKQSDIQIFLSRNFSEVNPQKQIPIEDHLGIEDWRLLTELKDILEPLYHQTLQTQGWSKQGSHGALWEVLIGMDLQQRTESLSDKSKLYFRLSILNGWKKLNEYYTKLEESPLYAASVILHPGLGFRWLEEQWSSPTQLLWLHSAKDRLYEYWERWYRDGQPASASRPSTTGEDLFGLRERQPTSETTQFEDWVHSRSRSSTQNDSELDRYLQLNPTQLQNVSNPLAWWVSQRTTFPTVSQLALDILAIPAMSADCERAFSLAKLTLTSQRLSMSSETLEHVQCLKNWLRRGSISLGGLHYNSTSIENS
ncbi:hypothetical protein NPX13_g2821 [Xylaria arbuscula]|uniref:HAT C-terminal dimerisation domain-containing protein n=1 Tax=Xylaria arbuscula TaxID=114810 RepID=A0A9W8NJD0_9PEZI|nr:hypothetical protein NPX13_g2821 [Xylaria arbuscula]